MAGCYYWLDWHEFEWTPGIGDGQRDLACCNTWGRKESDMTQRLNWTALRYLDVVKHHFWVCPSGCLWIRLIFESADWVKQSALSCVNEPQPIYRRPEYYRLSKQEFFLSVCFLLGYLYSPGFWLRLKFISFVFLILRCLIQTGTKLSAPLGLQLTDCRCWDILPCIITWASFLHYIS